jgi:hypothetical protein
MFERFSLKKREIEMEVEKDLKKAEDTIKKDAEVIKKDFKKAENYESFNMFLTYGWAIAIIIIGIVGLIWWNYFNIQNEDCQFLDGSGLFCENFDATHSGLTIEIRNLNNKSLMINEVNLKDCLITPNQTIDANDKETFVIPCNITSGRFSEKVVVEYTSDYFQKHVVARLSKIVP